MGQAFSSSSSNSKQTPASTPQRTSTAPTCADPRSPSQDIERTPIQVNTSVVNDENGFSASPATKEEKPRKQSLRQKMFARKKNDNLPAEE